MGFSDTSSEIAEMQLQIYRSMTGEQRLRIALEMSDLIKEFQKAGLRNLHPDWPEARVSRELIRHALMPEPKPDWPK